MEPSHAGYLRLPRYAWVLNAPLCGHTSGRKLAGALYRDASVTAMRDWPQSGHAQSGLQSLEAWNVGRSMC